ncbi:MAG: glucokinase [Oceanospirillaceae bacterium]|nr:glucokinase [Oceanospirillaceae bacterium]
MHSNNPENQRFSIVADVGGTNTRIALTKASLIQQATVQHFANDKFDSFEQLLHCYLKSQQVITCESACIAIATAVNGSSVRLTNRDWLIDKDSIAKISGAKRVKLINDYEALALSLNDIPAAQLTSLVNVREVQSSLHTSTNKIVLGAGTGFNAAQLISGPMNIKSQINCAECGHMTLPITNLQELKLRDYLASRHGRASVERVLSGRGLVQLYQWLCSEKKLPARDLSAAQIAESACADDDPVTRESAALFCRFFARVAGDLALAYLPYGGIYLSGGVTRGLAPMLREAAFMAEFTAKGRQSQLMQSFNIQLITSDNTALIGCAAALPEPLSAIGHQSSVN